MGLTVLIIDDEEPARINTGEFLKSIGYEVLGAATLTDGKALVMQGAADVVLLDVRLPDGYGPNLLYEMSNMPNRIPVIMITGYGDIEMAVEAMKNGAHDFLTKPFEFERLEQSIKRAGSTIKMRRELEHLRTTQQKVQFVVGKNPRVVELLSHAQRAAKLSAPVLITGETGTGKEVISKFIHQSGPRADKPFIAINCAAIQSSMLESELFGHEMGSFTSAAKKKIGLMEVADTGILFLDEIASMPLDIQAKLLRAIDEKAFRRVGGTSLIKVDVQIVAASNRDLPTMVAENTFRQDLYYRLKVVDLDLPPLRERKEDIPELVAFFVKQGNMKLGLNIQDIDPAALQALEAYDFPGNIRELSNAIERAMLFCDEAVLQKRYLPADIIRPNQ